MSTFAIFCVAIAAVGAHSIQARCDDNDGVLPKRLETALSTCRTDVESLIKSGVSRNLSSRGRRIKRDSLLRGEEISGCVLLCMFRKLTALDEEDIPTVESLIKHFGHGIRQPGYFLALTQAVQQCVSNGKKLTSDKRISKCTVSYKVFNCIRSQMKDYCQESR